MDFYIINTIVFLLNIANYYDTIYGYLRSLQDFARQKFDFDIIENSNKKLIMMESEEQYYSRKKRKIISLIIAFLICVLTVGYIPNDVKFGDHKLFQMFKTTEKQEESQEESQEEKQIETENTLYSGDRLIFNFQYTSAYYEEYDGEKWKINENKLCKNSQFYDVKLYEVVENNKIEVDYIEYNNEQPEIKKAKSGKYILEYSINDVSFYSNPFEVSEETRNNKTMTINIIHNTKNYIPNILRILDKDNKPMSNQTITISLGDEIIKLHTNDRGYTTFLNLTEDETYDIFIQTSQDNYMGSFIADSNNIIIELNVS